ncbi:MAG: DUF6152 family protein [Steroidobacteraceae bacterium]
MSDRLNRLIAAAGTSILLVAAVEAHHSQSEFDFRANVDVEGKVTKLEWKSPHARLYVDVINEKGEAVNWNFELPSPNTLMRRGWKRDSLKPGDQVKVNGARARNFPAIGYARSIRQANGEALFTGVTQIQEPEPAGVKPQ